MTAAAAADQAEDKNNATSKIVLARRGPETDLTDVALTEMTPNSTTESNHHMQLAAILPTQKTEAVLEIQQDSVP